MILKPVVVDNWYNKSEFKRVCKELDFYTDRNKLITQHGNVAVKEGVDQADCYRISIERHFTQEGRKMSDILTLMEKFRAKEFHEHIYNTCKIYRGFEHTTEDSTLIAYYEDTQYYKPHTDLAKYSVLIWIFKEPKKFTGGDLILPDLDVKIECKNNRMVLFPGMCVHEVTEIKMKKTKNKLGDGRWCIVHFFEK
tara:strand:+ start:2059 stop:2643 length:585 start_codon:yes stop_codon:yes gene_type:complete